MADGDLRASIDTTTAFDTTDLEAGIANGSGWVSNVVSRVSPTQNQVQFSGKVTADSNSVSGDVLMLYLLLLDGASSSEISSANLGPTSGDQEVILASTKAKQIGPPIATYVLSAASEVVYFVTPKIFCSSLSFGCFMYLISDAGTIGDSGDIMRYQLSCLQVQ